MRGDLRLPLSALRSAIGRWLRPVALSLALVLGALLPLPALAQAERMVGRFFGAVEAQGMRIELRRGGSGLVGTFHDSNGVTAPIDAQLLSNAAEATLEFPARKVRLRIFPEAVGLRVIAIPLDAGGNPVVEATNALVFLREGTKVPEIPAGYQAPVLKVRVVDPDTFLISYEFWPPEGVAYGWESLEARYRPLIGVFPVVMADVLWKLCGSTYRTPMLGEALRGQGVTCEEVLARIDEMQVRGTFAKFKADVAAEKKVALDAARCARGYTRIPAVCEPAARRVSEAAVSLVTVATVLRRYRGR